VDTRTDPETLAALEDGDGLRETEEAVLDAQTEIEFDGDGLIETTRAEPTLDPRPSTA
jgi:hypothetical protein